MTLVAMLVAASVTAALIYMIDSRSAAAPVTGRADTVGVTTLGTAHIWVISSNSPDGSCTRSASPVEYEAAIEQSKVCNPNDDHLDGVFNAAYQAALAGDMILIRGGLYAAPANGVHDISDRATLSGTRVVIQPARGETVGVDSGWRVQTHDLIVHGGDSLGTDEEDRIEVLGGIDVEMTAGQDNRNVILEDVNLRSVYFEANDFTIRFSDIGPNDPCRSPADDLVLSATPGTPGGTKDVVIEGNLIHGNDSRRCPTVHADALDVFLEGGVVRGNRIWACGTQCIFQGDPGSVLVENNMIEETNAYGSNTAAPCEIGMAGRNTIRYNTLEGSVCFTGSLPARANVYGNLFLNAQGCDPAATYTQNVFPASGGVTCGTNARRGTPVFADGKAYSGSDRQGDYHLHETDRAARNAGNPARFPPVDFDGALRPIGAVDAGADERS
jgi:hypothetical protein